MHYFKYMSLKFNTKCDVHLWTVKFNIVYRSHVIETTEIRICHTVLFKYDVSI